VASTRQTRLEELRARLQGISVAGGYATDAGAEVFMGEAPAMGENDPDVAIAMIIGDDVGRRQGKAIFVTLPIEVQAIAKVDLDEPWAAIEAVLGDIHKAIEVDDETMHVNDKRGLEVGTTRTMPREPGSLSVGVGVTYVLSYARAWGQP